VAHVDDRIQPGSQKVALASVASFLRSHQPLAKALCNHRITNQLCKESPRADVIAGKIQPPLAACSDVRSGTCTFFTDDWPVLVFAADYKLKALTDLEKGLAIGLTFILASLTYKAIERPIRFSKRWNVVAPLTLTMAAIAVIGILPSLAFVPKLPDAVTELTTVSPGEGMRAHECMLFETDNNDFSPDSVDRARPLVAIWGDSTASALVRGFRKLHKTTPFGIAQFTVASCSPVLVPHPPLTELCVQRNQNIAHRIADASPDLVILEAIWNGDDNAEMLKPSIEALRKSGIHKIIVPVWLRKLPEVVATYYRRTGKFIPASGRLLRQTCKRLLDGARGTRTWSAIHIDLETVDHLPTYPLDRLSRYEGSLWRQACQLLFALQFLGRPTPWERMKARIR
jgi:hypothetical protein